MSLNRAADERWWDERTPRPKVAQRPPRMSAGTRMCMYATVLMVVLGLFAQIGRIAAISDQGKAIAQLRGQIQELNVEGQYLTIELSARQSIDRVRDEAMGRLGMTYPQEGQVRVVSLASLDASGFTAQAGAGEPVDVAQGDASG